MTKIIKDSPKGRRMDAVSFFFYTKNENYKGYVASPDEETDRQYFMGYVHDYTSRYVLWGNDYYFITDRITGDRISTDYPKELWSMTDEEVAELDETTWVKKSEALAAKADKAEFDKLWAEIKARGE